MLAVTWCRGLSRFVSISYTNRKEESISSLNMNKLASFGVNVLRDLILAMDSGLLTLIDIKTKKEYRSRKAHNEKLVRSCFTSDGKSVLLLNHRMKLYVLNVSDLKEKWNVQLPHVFSDAQIHVSFDGHWAIIR